MNYTLQNIVTISVTLFALIFVIYFFFLRQPYQYIPDSIGSIGCIYPVYIKEDILEPTLTENTYIFLNQCIGQNETIQVGSIVYFEYEEEKQLGILTNSKGDSYIVDFGIEDNMSVVKSSILGYNSVE